MGPLHGTLLFHLNLNYSAIEVAERGEVVRRCYRPLLGLLDRLPWLTLAIEASGHTLERIERLDPDWLARLRALVEAGRVELVGSGDSQLIGPLVPAGVNAWNQRLGQETYARLVGRRPRTALVNELAWSQGIVDAYLEAGYETVLMEWNNPRRLHPEWENEWRHGFVRTPSPGGQEIDLLWVDAVAFQKFQRVVMGDLEIEEYVDWVLAHETDRPRHLCLYGNDAEIFDFRPGRYAAEPPLAQGAGEWERMAAILERLHERGVSFTTPALLRQDPCFQPSASVVLNDAADPIPVKKQPKYNATRWALTGWDDVGVNARCFARARDLERRGGKPEEWRTLCRAWASDLRTHLTRTRWEALSRALPSARATSREEGEPRPALRTARVERDDRRIRITTDDVHLSLLTSRGLAIEALSFASSGNEPLCGTLPHGSFDDIDWAADFYSGHTVMEIPAHARVTDLERIQPDVRLFDDRIEIVCEVPTALGPLEKEIVVYAGHVELRYGFSRWVERPLGSLRTGFVTLRPESFGRDLAITCANGGAPERFVVRDGCHHGRSVSPLISAGAVFGATDGKLAIDDGRVGLELSWPQWRSAALPLLTCKQVGRERFVRVAFSLSEIDETHRPGAPLHDFELAIRPLRVGRLVA